VCLGFFSKSGRTTSVGEIQSGSKNGRLEVSGRRYNGITMWSSIEDIIEIVAAVLVILAALWAITAKVWRAPHVVNRESNLLERLEALLTKNETAMIDSDKQLTRKRVS
jgi:hypothetical protein